jgi:hypothetical protein
MVVRELVTRRSIGKTEEIGAAATTEARNRVYGSGGDDYQGGSGCGSGNKSEYLASVEVAEREDGVAVVEGNMRSREGDDGGGGSRSGGDGDKGTFLTLGGGGWGAGGRREERRLVAYAHKEGGVDSTRHKIHT